MTEINLDMLNNLISEEAHLTEQIDGMRDDLNALEIELRELKRKAIEADAELAKLKPSRPSLAIASAMKNRYESYKVASEAENRYLRLKSDLEDLKTQRGHLLILLEHQISNAVFGSCFHERTVSDALDRWRKQIPSDEPEDPFSPEEEG